MYRVIGFTTALTVFATLPASPAAAADIAELLVEEHYSQAGYEVDLYVTRGADGDVLSEGDADDDSGRGGAGGDED